jgi:signal transduction histidine kinase
MRYDDRLATVLRLVPAGPSVARIQLRQLIDLLGTMPSDARGDLVDAAYLRLTELAMRLPMAERTRILAQPGQRLRSPRLMATLCTMEPQVASAAIRAADLTQEQWLDLIPALPLAARGFLRDKADLPPAARTLLARLGVAHRALPDAAAELLLSDPLPEPEPEPASARPPAPPPSGNDSIGAIVRRIEAFRRARKAAPPTDAPQLPLEGDVTPAQAIRVFDFTSDAEGRILWAEGGVAPMVAGHLLAGEPALALAIRQHQPFHALPLTLDGAEAVAGQWQVDGVPRFDPLSGRFVGHVGRMRRLAVADAATPPDGKGDRLRQVLHELRTPVNAIQGFAEIIQQQLFGPTPHEYRALAASIAADSARMLAGFEELERFARLDGGAMELASGHCDLTECVTATLARLAPQAHARGITLALDGLNQAPIALPVIEAERLIWRLLATLSTHAVTGEHLTATLARQDRRIVLELPLPATLAALDDEALFHSGTGGDGTGPWAGMFGTGFALRLAGAEARCAGGGMERQGGKLYLTLPGLTQMTVEPSHSVPGDKGRAAPPAA